jgi:hypothetical protein
MKDCHDCRYLIDNCPHSCLAASNALVSREMRKFGLIGECKRWMPFEKTDYEHKSTTALGKVRNLCELNNNQRSED